MTLGILLEGSSINRQMQSRLGPYGRAHISVYQGL